MSVGAMIHKIRKDRKMTLLELSEKSGVALATLSRMENGRMTGTLESHINISKALGVSLPDIYKDLIGATRKVEVHGKGSRPDVFVHDKKSTSEMLVANSLNKKMMPVMIKMAKSGRTHPEETKPGIEKFIYIIEGKLEANIGNDKFDLSKGDTLYFEASLPHSFKNVGNSDARLISVVTPPTL